MKKFCIYGLFAIAIVIFGCKESQVNNGLQEVQLKTETVELEREIVSVENKQVKLQTTMGDIVIELNGKAAPNTVINFLNYVESGFYDGVIFHRVIPNFMIQGGGFTAQMERKEADDPVKNEFSISNTRGTIAMARQNSPDTATNQFFINHKDNPNLDTYTGGYAVFGKVVKGMDAVDTIAGVRTHTVMVFDEKYKRNVPYQDVPVEAIMITKASRL